MKLKVKRLKISAKLPTRCYETDAGLDLYACIDKEICFSAQNDNHIVIPLGVAVEIPDGYYGHMVGRSGLATKGIFCHQGTIDSGYRGELNAILYSTDMFPHINVGEPVIIKNGDRIAQLIILKCESPEIIEVRNLTISPRQERGLGSTGR